MVANRTKKAKKHTSCTCAHNDSLIFVIVKAPLNQAKIISNILYLFKHQLLFILNFNRIAPRLWQLLRVRKLIFYLKIGENAVL